MVVPSPEHVSITDELSKDLLFKFLCSGHVAFSDFLERWFSNNSQELALFMNALDEAGLQIVKKEIK